MQFQLDNRENLRQVWKKHLDSCHANLLLIFHNGRKKILSDHFQNNALIFYHQHCTALDGHSMPALSKLVTKNTSIEVTNLNGNKLINKLIIIPIHTSKKLCL